MAESKSGRYSIQDRIYYSRLFIGSKNKLVQRKLRETFFQKFLLDQGIFCEATGTLFRTSDDSVHGFQIQGGFIVTRNIIGDCWTTTVSMMPYCTRLCNEHWNS